MTGNSRIRPRFQQKFHELQIVAINIGLARESHAGALAVSSLAKPNGNAGIRQRPNILFTPEQVGLYYGADVPLKSTLNLKHNLQGTVRVLTAFHIDLDTSANLLRPSDKSKDVLTAPLFRKIEPELRQLYGDRSR